MAILEMMMPSYGVTVSTVTFVNLGTLGSSGNAITVGQPASPQANDVWVMVVQSANEAITTPTNATSGTWAEIATQVGSGTAATAGSTRLGFYWHRWTTTTGNITLADTGNHQLCRIAAYRGCRTTSNPWNTVSVMSSGTSIRQPAITTTVANCRALMAYATIHDIADGADDFQFIASSPVTDPQERLDNQLATGTGGGIALCDGLMATASSTDGSTNGIGGTVTSGISPIIKCCVALEPA